MYIVIEHLQPFSVMRRRGPLWGDATPPLHSGKAESALFNAVGILKRIPFYWLYPKPIPAIL